MALIYIDNIAFPTPSDYFVDMELLENSERDSEGVLHRDIKREALTISCAWNYLAAEQYYKVSQLRLKRKAAVMVRFFDDHSQRFVTKKMYGGKLSKKVLSLNAAKDKPSRYTNISIKLIEY